MSAAASVHCLGNVGSPTNLQSCRVTLSLYDRFFNGPKLGYSFFVCLEVVLNPPPVTSATRFCLADPGRPSTYVRIWSTTGRPITGPLQCLATAIKVGGQACQPLNMASTPHVKPPGKTMIIYLTRETIYVPRFLIDEPVADLSSTHPSNIRAQ